MPEFRAEALPDVWSPRGGLAGGRVGAGRCAATLSGTGRRAKDLAKDPGRRSGVRTRRRKV